MRAQWSTSSQSGSRSLQSISGIMISPDSSLAGHAGPLCRLVSLAAIRVNNYIFTTGKILTDCVFG